MNYIFYGTLSKVNKSIHKSRRVNGTDIFIILLLSKERNGTQELKPEAIISKIYVFRSSCSSFYYHLVVIGSGILIEPKCFCFSSIKNFNSCFFFLYCRLSTFVSFFFVTYSFNIHYLIAVD